MELHHHHGSDDPHQRHLPTHGKVDPAPDHHKGKPDRRDDEVGILGDDIGQISEGKEIWTGQ